MFSSLILPVVLIFLTNHFPEVPFSQHFSYLPKRSPLNLSNSFIYNSNPSLGRSTFTSYPYFFSYFLGWYVISLPSSRAGISRSSLFNTLIGINPWSSCYPIVCHAIRFYLSLSSEFSSHFGSYASSRLLVFQKYNRGSRWLQS